MEKTLKKIDFIETEAEFTEFLAYNWPVNLTVSNTLNKLFKCLNLINLFKLKLLRARFKFFKKIIQINTSLLTLIK